MLPVGLSAQHALETVYDVTSGLPFQETTNAYKDTKGQLWVEYSNQEYISRFDGISWTHYKFVDFGMPPGLAIERETKEGLWFYKFDAINETTALVLLDHQQQWHLFNIKGIMISDIFQKVTHFTYLDHQNKIYKYVDTSFVPTDRVIPAEIIGQNHYISGILYSDPNTIVLYLNAKNQINPNARLMVYNFDDHALTFSESIDERLGRPVFLTKNKYYKPEDIQIGYDIQNAGLKFKIKGFADGSQYYNNFYTFYNDKISSTFSIKNSQSKKDIYLFDDRDNKVMKIDSFLNEGFRSSILSRDDDNNMWYATPGGLFRRNPHILTFSESTPNMVNGLHTLAEDDKGKIWFGGYNQSGWSYWDGQRLQKPKDKGLLSNRVLPGSVLQDGKIWFFEESNDYTALSFIENGHLKKMHFPEAVTPGFYFTSLRSGKIAAGLAGKGLLIFDPEKPSDYTIKNKDRGLLLQNVLTISEDKNNRLWLGRMSQGVACYDPKSDTVVTWMISPENPKSFGAISSKIDMNEDLWLGTSRGLYFVSKPHAMDILKNSVFDQALQTPLTGNYFERIHSLAENKRYIIAGSEKGIHLMDKRIKPDTEGRRRVYTLWYGEDIPGKGSEQNAILMVSKGYLWVGTNEGALRLDIDDMSFDTSRTVLNLSSVTIGGTTMDINAPSITGPKGQRSLDITWTAEGNTHFQNNVYATVLIVNSKNDTLYFNDQSQEKKINITHLPPDIYRLIIKGYKNNQLDAVFEKNILIPKLLSERISFWLVAALLMVLIPFLFILYVSRSRRRKAEYDLMLEKSKRNQDSYRIKSLSNFFNPHFINNTLHWLQSKYRKDEETATMIDSLASNVELLYQNMQQGVAYHSLKKETELVNNYLDIQQVRFGHILKISKFIDPGIILENIPVPSMLLQIHVENAVEKGIRNRPGAHELSISITEDAHSFLISIEDDGRGRLSLGPDENRKGSTEVMNDLIDILNSYNQHKIKVTYDDRIIGDRYGTRVCVYLPKNFNYEFEKI
jgi:ligand-binding sensor domain-containing protein